MDFIDSLFYILLINAIAFPFFVLLHAIYRRILDKKVIREVRMLIPLIPHPDIRNILMSLPMNLTDIINAPGGVDKDGLWINPSWWILLTAWEKLFVLYHEAMHIKLGHLEDYGVYNKDLNTALDICVNQVLVEHYGFYYEDVKNFKFIENVFTGSGAKNVLANQTPEYYLGLIKFVNKFENK